MTEPYIISIDKFLDRLRCENPIWKNPTIDSGFSAMGQKLLFGLFCRINLLLVLLPISGFGQEIDLPIYLLETYGREEGFIPLTDMYPWSHHPDSILIPEKYTEPYYLSRDSVRHTLAEDKRQIFLGNLDISESDQIFIYNYEMDTIFVLRVKETPLIADLNIYSFESPFPQEQFVIGFEIEKKLIDEMGDNYSNSFVSIGNVNPFQTGNIHPILFENAGSTEIPISIRESIIVPTNMTTGGFHKGNTDGFTFYLHDNMRENSKGKKYVSARHLIIHEEATQTTVYNEMLYEGESSSFTPLSSDSPDFFYQRIGTIFKGMPPVIFNFMWVAFDCPWIDFLDGKGSFIRIRCDNRH